MPSPQSVAEQKAVDVPLYTYLDAARYLRVPVWVVLSVSARPPRHAMNLFERFWRDESFRAEFANDYWPPLEDGEATRISFRSLASIFISSAIFRPQLTGLSFPPCHLKEVLQLMERIHEAAHEVAEDPRLWTDSKWVMDQYTQLFKRMKDADQNQILKLIALHQSRIEFKDGTPVQLFPFSRDPAPDAPRSIVIDPELRFGRPTVKGAPTDNLAERWRAGDRSSELAEDYGLTSDEVEEALRYEAMPYELPFL